MGLTKAELCEPFGKLSQVNVKPVYNTGDMGTDLLQKSIFDIPGGLESE